jgi:hypothetical protein
MTATFSNLKFMQAVNERYAQNSQMWQIAAEPMLRGIYEEACPLIEKRLADYDHLSKYNWNGMQAFYDDERGGRQMTKGGLTRGGFSGLSAYGDHLKDQFIVVGSEAGGFEITNTKTVSSSRGNYNLFDLLWHGWGAYSAGQRMSGIATANELKRIKGMSREEKDTYAVNMGYSKPMTYYYRYMGQWFYRCKSRGGFTPSLHDKFKRYILDAVDWGIEQAMKNIIERGDSTKEMKEVFEAMT